MNIYIFFFIYSDNKWLWAFKAATLLILFLTLIRCLSECLSKFGNIRSRGQALSDGSSPGTKIIPEVSLTDQNGIGSVNDSITI